MRYILKTTLTTTATTVKWTLTTNTSYPTMCGLNRNPWTGHNFGLYLYLVFFSLFSWYLTLLLVFIAWPAFLVWFSCPNSVKWPIICPSAPLLEACYHCRHCSDTICCASFVQMLPSKVFPQFSSHMVLKHGKHETLVWLSQLETLPWWKGHRDGWAWHGWVLEVMQGHTGYENKSTKHVMCYVLPNSMDL